MASNRSTQTLHIPSISGVEVEDEGSEKESRRGRKKQVARKSERRMAEVKKKGKAIEQR